MAKSSSSSPAKTPELKPQPLRVDAAMLLHEVDAANISLGPLIANARKSLLRGSPKARLNVGEALNTIENVLTRLIPNVIRSSVRDALHTEGELQPVWDEILELTQEAKNAIPFKATKPLQRNIAILFSQAHDNICRALQTNGNGTTTTKKSNQVISYQIDEQPVSLESIVDTDIPEEMAPFPSVQAEEVPVTPQSATIDISTYSLTELLEAEGMLTVDEQAEYIASKFLHESARAFSEFLAAVRSAPYNYGEKMSKADAEFLVQLYAKLENVVTTAIKGGSLTLKDIRSRLKSSLVLAAFEAHLEKLHEKVAGEFEVFPLEALGTVWDGLVNDEDLYLNLSNVRAESAFRTVEDIVFTLQWETIEKGVNAPLTQKQEDFLRTRFPRKVRDQKDMRSNTPNLKKIAGEFNRTFFGGYALKDEAFILCVLNTFIARADKPHAAPAPIVPKVEPPVVEHAELTHVITTDDVAVGTEELAVVIPEEAAGASEDAQPEELQTPSLFPEQVGEVVVTENELVVEVIPPTAPQTPEVKAVPSIVETPVVDMYRGFTRQEVELACEVLKERNIKKVPNMPKSLRKEIWRYVNEKLGRMKPENVQGYKQWDLIFAALALNELAEQTTQEEYIGQEKMMQQVVDTLQPSESEIDAARKMFWRDLRDGGEITTARLDIYLAGINVRRFRSKLSIRTRQFAADLIASLRPPFIPQPPTEVIEVVHDAISVQMIGGEVQTEQPSVSTDDHVIEESFQASITESVPDVPLALADVAPDVALIKKNLLTETNDVLVAENVSEPILTVEDNSTMVAMDTLVSPEVPAQESIIDSSMQVAPALNNSAIAKFSGLLEANLHESLQLAEDSIQVATGLLADLKEYTASLRANVESISGSIGNLLGAVFNDEVRALLNTARISAKELAEAGRLDQVRAETETVVADISALIELRAERANLAQRVLELLESQRSVSLNAQRAFEFYRQANREIFGVKPIEVLEADEQQRVEAIEEFRHQLTDAKTDLEDLLATHLDTIQLEIDQSALGGTLDLDQVHSAFDAAFKKLRPVLPKISATKLTASGASESLESLTMSPLQLKLLQMLTAVTGERHPRSDTWGRTSGKLIQMWNEIFDDEPPTNPEVFTALADMKLCENMLDYKFSERPNKRTMKPLRDSNKPLVCWTFDGNIFFMPSWKGYDYMESAHQPLSSTALKKLEVFLGKGKKPKMKKKA